ncbi:MAG: tetratricopeptide repeat protein, partial [Proteobacteria bacterium]|nr:tetratricopeptide repeat protein [Pseudomonadota bacterium]
MADLSSLLAVLEHDPDDTQALDALVSAANTTAPEVRASRFANSRKVVGGRGRPDTVVRMLDAELAVTTELDRKADLLLEKGMVLDGDLLDVPAARHAFQEVLQLRPDDAMAKEALDEIELGAQNWQKFAEKFLLEAHGSTDRSLQTGLYMSAAEAHVRYAPEGVEAETHLRTALDVDPKNAKAAFHLARLLRRAQRWGDLTRLLEERAAQAPTTEERVSSLLALYVVAREQQEPAMAEAAIRRVLALDPGQPQALRAVGDVLAAAGNWKDLVAVYQAAIKARGGDDDLGMLLQVGMMLWRHLDDLDQAEDFFRRIRKIDPSHPAALDFYRAYYPAKGENAKLIAMLKQVEKAPASPAGLVDNGVPQAPADPRGTGGQSRPISMEIAELSEAQNNPEKAIEAWKQHLRQDPTSTQARTALQRLYRKTEKWNALLDLMKDEIEKLPESELAAKVARLLDVVEIYRDKLRLDVMVINTYNAILKLDPDNQRATDELA